MLKTITFSVGQNVRLTKRASKIHGGDKKVHSVKKVDLIPEDLYEDGGSKSWAMILGIPRGVKTREFVGHHQWVFLEDDRRISGADLELVR